MMLLEVSRKKLNLIKITIKQSLLASAQSNVIIVRYFINHVDVFYGVIHKHVQTPQHLHFVNMDNFAIIKNVFVVVTNIA